MFRTTLSKPSVRLGVTGLVACVAMLVVAQAQAGPLCLVGATVHPVSSPSGDYDVCIADGVIASVERTGAPVPEGFDTLDVSGAVITPGFVETRSSIGLVEVWAVGHSRDHDAGGPDEIRASFRVHDALNPASTLLPIARSGGVTSAVVNPAGGLVSGQAAWWDLSGADVEDSVVATPAALRLAFGSGGGSATGASRASALRRYRQLFEDVALYARDPARFDQRRVRPLSATRHDLEVLASLLEGEVPALVGADRASDIRQAVAMFDEYGIRGIIAGGAEAWREADLLAEADVPVIVNPMSNLPASFDAIGSRPDNAALLDAAGVSVIITTEDTHNARLLRQYAGNAVRAGMAWDDALAAITLRPAEAFGVGADYGSIEAGKIANLAVWSGDPFELATRLSQLYIRGEAVSTTTRQDALFERYRTLPARGAPPVR